MKGNLLSIALTGLILTACAPATPPPPDPIEVQATAMAAASTMLAQTQAAMPTPTPVPPTPLPSPTSAPSPTPLALPTLSAGAASTAAPAAGNGTANPCNGLLSTKPKGPLTTMKIVNANKAPVTVSLYLSKTPFGECGYRAYSLGPLDSVYDETTLPQGCYAAFALVNDPKKPSKAFSTGPMCPNNDDKWTMVVQAEVIKFYSP